MELGIALPHMGETSPESIVRVAQEAEQLGFASLWVGERLLRPRRSVSYGYPPGPMPDYFACVYDPLETLSFVAAKTERIKLGTSVIVPFWHAPVVLARRFATLDQFSQGRVIAGLGQGWLQDEFEAANVSMKRRGNGLEDYLGALRACWGPDPVHYEGRFYRIGESEVGPKPRQVGGPPIILGVGSRAALERAARLADGLNPVALDWKILEHTLRTYRDLVRKAGRDPQQMQIIVRSNSPVNLSGPQSAPRPLLGGPLEAIREDVQRLEELGVNHLFFDPVSLPLPQRLQLLPKLRSVVT